MELNTMFEQILGAYTPVMVNNNWAFDVPYIMKGIFLLILLYATTQAFLIVLRGLFRK